MRNVVRDRLFLIVILAYLFVFLHGASAGSPSNHAASEERFITVETLRDSLSSRPIVAGFDVDDTVIFSSPGFFFAMNNTEAPGGKNRYGSKPLENPQFWRDLNQFHDRYSLKKLSGEKLIRMHTMRGDRIVFITKRYCYDDDAEVLKKRMDAMFSVNAKIYCTNEQTKTPVMAEVGVDIYYGDADSDIKDAQAVTSKHVRAIRVQRSLLSTNPRDKGYQPGTLGEEVLTASEN